MWLGVCVPFGRRRRVCTRRSVVRGFGFGGVTDQAVGPEVGHLDFQFVFARLDGVGNVDPPRCAPDDAEVLAVESDACDFMDFAEVEENIRILG